MFTTGSEIFYTLKANMLVNELCVILQIFEVPLSLVFEIQKKMWNPRNWMWCSENKEKNFKKHTKHQKHPDVKKDVVKNSKQRFFDTKNGNLCFPETRIFNIHSEKVGGNHMFWFNFWNFLEIGAQHHVVSFLKNSDKAQTTSQNTSGIFTMAS